MNKKILKEHQIIDNEINLEYNNVGELLSTKADENKEKKFLICPGKNDEEFTYSSFINFKILLFIIGIDTISVVSVYLRL